MTATRPPARYLPAAVLERIVVDDASGCWRWTGGRTGRGYAAVTVDRRSVPAHRYVYAASGRPIPAGMQLDHVCHDPATCPGGIACPHRACVNPAHLRPVTPAQNNAPGRRNAPGRAWRDGRCPRGHDVTTPDAVDVDRLGHRRCRECRALAASRAPRTAPAGPRPAARARGPPCPLAAGGHDPRRTPRTPARGRTAPRATARSKGGRARPCPRTGVGAGRPDRDHPGGMWVRAPPGAGGTLSTGGGSGSTGARDRGRRWGEGPPCVPGGAGRVVVVEALAPG